MTSLDDLPLQQIKSDAKSYFNESFTEAVSLEGLFVYGSFPDGSATEQSDIDILFVVNDDANYVVLQKLESFSGTYDGYPVDAFAVIESEYESYLSSAGAKANQSRAYNLLRDEIYEL